MYSVNSSVWTHVTTRVACATCITWASMLISLLKPNLKHQCLQLNCNCAGNFLHYQSRKELGVGWHHHKTARKQGGVPITYALLGQLNTMINILLNLANRELLASTSSPAEHSWQGAHHVSLGTLFGQADHQKSVSLCIQGCSAEPCLAGCNQPSHAVGGPIPIQVSHPATNSTFLASTTTYAFNVKA